MVIASLTIEPDQEHGQAHAKALMSGPKESTWELLEEGPKVEGVCTLEFCRLDGRERIPLEEIRNRLGEFAQGAGQNHLGFIHSLSLFGGPDVTPRPLDGYELYFPGTLWRHTDGALLMPLLYQGGRFGLWRLSYQQIDPSFQNHAHALFARIVS